MWGNGNYSSNANAGKLGVGVECGDCHDPHNPAWSPDGLYDPNTNPTDVIYQYRMLKLASPAGGDTVAYSTISRLAVPARPVNSTDPSVTGYTDSYAQTYVAGRPVTSYQPDDRIGAFCAQCHTRYMRGLSTSHASTGIVEEMSTGDTVFAYQHATEEATCETASCHVGTSFTRPRCLDCHNAHGTTATMGTYSSAVPWPGFINGVSIAPSPDTDINRSSLLRVDNRGVCTACHTK